MDSDVRGVERCPLFEHWLGPNVYSINPFVLKPGSSPQELVKRKKILKVCYSELKDVVGVCRQKKTFKSRGPMIFSSLFNKFFRSENADSLFL